MLPLWFHFYLLRLAVGRTCLPNAVLENQRSNISFDGMSLPVGIWQNGWDSSGIVSQIYRIVVSERLGFHVAFDVGPASELILGKLAGCAHEGFAITGDCGPPRRFHVSFENWLTGSPWAQQWLVDLEPYGTPVDLGDMGYEGKSGMFVLSGSLKSALADSGLALNFYRSYNASWFNPSKYTAPVETVDLSRLKTCQNSAELGYPGLGELYWSITGDTAGILEVNGKKVLNCWQDKWWIAPACRTNLSTCVPVLMPWTAWGLPEMMQQAFWHNMPLAFATASDADYITLNRELQSLLYTYIPDSTFFLDQPSQVIFPDHSPSEYANSIYKTMKTNTVLSKWAAAGFDIAAEKPFAVAKNLRMGFEDIMQLLSRHVQSNTPDLWETACAWLLENEAHWNAWIPSETECALGKGLVDADGNFIMDRGLATSCEFCPVGTKSTESGTTRVCQACEAGTSQMLPGESSCTPCEPGTVPPTEGAMECTACELGKYAMSSGMSECEQCGPPDQIRLWTTSKPVQSQGEESWIQVEAATSNSSCTCIEGYFLLAGRCERCIRGSSCPGSNRLSLLPGFSSSVEEPGEIFQCFGEPERCPGGDPGTCAEGRNAESLACSSCLGGLHAQGGECVPCETGDFFLVVVVALLACLGIAILYVVSLRKGQKAAQPGNLLIAALGLGQMVTVVQQLTVVQQFKIQWGEPFSSMLISLDIFAFDLDLISIGCVAPMGPVGKFTMRTLMVLIFFMVACLIHGICTAIQRKGLQLSVLGSTVGTLFMVFFISMCSSLLAPFRCYTHPNGQYTVQDYHSVLCDMKDEHLHMSLIGGFCCLLPIGFLSACSYLTLVQLPKWIANGEVRLIRACSFLFVRFRPGAEVYSVLLSPRNALVVLCPLLPSASGRILCMNVVLCGSLVMVAYGKPWRHRLCNALDLFLLSGMLVILDMGSLFIRDVDVALTAAICIVFSVFMCLSVLLAVGYGLFKHIMQKYKKPFHFFVCHQKNAAGSYARLLKIELQQRGPRFSTFIDCDDLNDLTKLFSYVGQDTQTLLILGSPQILTRKWCVGEMVTGRLQKVHTVLLTFPGFQKPDERFIETYTTLVPDITELANYNIGLDEVEATLRWINEVPTIEVPALIHPETINEVVNSLTGMNRARSMHTGAHEESGCLILVDLDNMEAASTAFVLLRLIRKKVIAGIQGSIPHVLMKEDRVPANVRSVLLICSEGCFSSLTMASWLLQVLQVTTCSLLPIIAEDGFRFPSDVFYEQLLADPALKQLDLDTYVKIIRAVFQEIAVVFSPQNYSSTAEDLELRASQVAWRLQNGLQPLPSKVQVPDKPEHAEHDAKSEDELDRGLVMALEL